MATVSERAGMIADERRFFFMMAIAITATVFIGFGMGFQRSNWAILSLPPYVHLHGAVFIFWILLYLLQNGLVASGSVAIHRTLGILGAVVAAVMVVVGIATTMLALEAHRVPFFFTPGIFLVLDLLGIIGFGLLTGWAIAVRHRPDWHKRLMLCGTILVMSPALGRILPMPLLGMFATLAVFAVMALYVLVAMAYDLRSSGRIHPAYWWGSGVLVATQLFVVPLGLSPPVVRLADQLSA